MTTKAAERRVYRSRDAYIGGVCAGLADAFDLDPIVVRILAILIVGVTLGLGVIAYLVLWARMPREPEKGSLFEVKPESAESSSYGCLDCDTGKTAQAGSSPRARNVPIIARLAVAAGLVLLFLAVATGLSPRMPGTEWWQFWPLAPLIVGLCLVIIPIPTHYETAWHALGIVVLSCSAAVLPMSLGVISWSTVPVAFTTAWPLLAVAVAAFAFGVYRDVDALMIGAAFLVAAFCLFALMACVVPGETDALVFHMLDGRVMRISIISR